MFPSFCYTLLTFPSHSEHRANFMRYFTHHGKRILTDPHPSDPILIHLPDHFSRYLVKGESVK